MQDKTAGQIDPSLVVAFMKSVKNVLSTMANLESTLGKPTIKTEDKPAHDVSGIVGFSGEVTGNVVITFSEEASMKVVESFVGMPMEFASEDFADAIGELCNMIAGNAKKDFGVDASIGIPSVIIGKNHTVARLRDVPCVAIPCKCDAGEFSVEVNIKQVTCVAGG